MPGAKVAIHRLAAEEYHRICRWYLNERPELERSFADEFDRVLTRVAADPLCGSIFRKDYRWLRLRRFPYVVYYAVIDPTSVLVLAVSHGRRRPGYWMRRAKKP